MEQFYTIILKFLKNHRIHQLALHRIRIGRDPSCEISFPDNPAISGLHAVLYFENGAWYLMDMGSAKGTKLNRMPLVPEAPYLLNDGDRIIFGGSEYATVEKGPASYAIDSEIQMGGYDVTLPAQAPGSVSSGSPLHAPKAPENAPAIGRCCPVCASSFTGVVCPVCGFRVTADRETLVPGLSIEAPRSPSFCDACYWGEESPVPPMAPPAPAPAASSAPPAPARKQKASFWSGLFGSKKEKTPPVQADDVQFRAAAPASLKPGEYFPVKVMMYREEDHQRADREQMTVGDKVKASSSGIFQAKLQERFRIALQSPDIPIDTESAELVWNGKYAATELEVFLPEGYDRKQLRLTGRIYSGIAVITDLKMILQVEASAKQEVLMEKCRLRSAFISYASQDRAKVVARIQGIQLSCPDMDLFFDVESLRRGEHWEQRLYREIESRDLFYLFWSRNAANSQWVGKELAFAVEKKGLPSIEPVPLEDPVVCPPPLCLRDRHFNDWTLRYLSDT